MGDVNITIQWGTVRDNGEYEQSWTYYADIVPAIGSHFSAWSSRDIVGEYLSKSIIDNKGREVVSGRVLDVRYHVAERGQDSGSHSITMWAFVVIEPDTEYWEGSAPAS